MITHDDETLAQKAASDVEAFSELYRRYLHRVYSYLLVKVGQAEDAQDLTAQTFVAMLETIAHYKSQDKFAAWLLGIAKHKAHDHWRRKRINVSLEMAESLPDPTPPPEETVFAQLQREGIAEKLRTLKPDRAEALTLRIFGELSFTEVGQVMGKSEAAAKMLVYRAYEDLREQMKEYVP